MRSSRRSLLVATNRSPKATQKSHWDPRRIFTFCLLGIGVCGLLYSVLVKKTPSGAEFSRKSFGYRPVNNKTDTQSLYALGSVEDIDGSMKNLSEFAGNVSIVVNVASYCGFTASNYKGLQSVYEKYKDKGFTVLAFPCNQFGHQEPKDCPQIKTFAMEKYHVTFPMFSKIDVNGPKTHSVYQFLKSHLPKKNEQGGDDFDLKWNFQKFLVNREGMPVKLFKQKFNQSVLETAIEELLQSRQR